MYVLVAVIAIFQLAAPLAFSIASLVIGSQNMNTTCDHSATSFLSLSTWLIVYGSLTLVFVVMAAVSISLLITGHASFFITYAFTAILGGLFMFAWNIVGAVSLFRDSPTCQSLAYSMWAMTLAVLIFQWVGMFVSCFTSTKSKEHK